MPVFIGHANDNLEAICSMIFRDLPPVGDTISTKASSAALPEMPGYTTYALDSGTSALAVAFALVVKQRPDIAQPEVILPAYGCPDLVAAAQYAGLGIRLVDIGSASNPQYDLALLKQAVNDNTVAVLALNFLGVRERLPEIKASVPESVTIIEDNAQWFPEDGEVLHTDLAIVSFGRGKPLSLLGGGMLYVREGSKFDHSDLVSKSESLLGFTIQKAVDVSASITKAKIHAYNVLLHPLCYVYLNRNPFITLGRTVFHPINEVREMDSFRYALLSENYARYRHRSRDLESQYTELFTQFGPDIKTLPDVQEGQNGRLLRYPVVCENAEVRDHLVQQFDAAGLGASPMYGRALGEINGVAAEVLASPPAYNAQAFAKTFFSLPLHKSLRYNDFLRIGKIMRSVPFVRAKDSA